MFIGREKELQKLHKMYASGRPEVAIIYGRRRVGKTTLINHFCRDKKTIFFAAQESSATQNLEALSEAISQTEGRDGVSSPVFRSFEDAFAHIAGLARQERIIFVIDEYPYLAAADKSVSSVLQHVLDHACKEGQLFLILCGSSMSFMEHQVLGYQSPLYGRRTAQFKILPFDYRDTGKWFPNYSAADRAVMYGITGGVPLYLEQFSPEQSVRENLLENVFDANAMLFEEPSNLLKQELREPAMYNAIITAVAGGRSKLSEIASAVGMETGLCSKYIGNLITLGLMRREVPVTEPSSRRPVYEIADPFFRFWYTFVPRSLSNIVAGRMEESYEAAVGCRLSHYMGLTFERMCRDYLLYYDRELPFLPEKVGQWWGGNPRTRRQAQIDVVMTSMEGDCAIVGSCKFRKEPLAETELELMREYAEAMGGFSRYYYYFFSKGGFTRELEEKAGETVRLFTLEELYQ
ncbi:MAG: ATP-binding protein [Eubacteriales bacterium]|nr:ATP-binding protein [Eubacteriales bacterium]